VVDDNIRQDTPYSALATACCSLILEMRSTKPGRHRSTRGIQHSYNLGANAQASSYPVNPAFANGVAPDGALCAEAACATTNPVSLFGALPHQATPYVYIFSDQIELQPVRDWCLSWDTREAEAGSWCEPSI